MDMIVVIECGADETMTADYYRKSFNLGIFNKFFDDVKIMGHIEGADIYTKNKNSLKFGIEGRKIIRDLAEKEKFAVYSTPVFWGPYMTKGTKIKNFIRYGMSLDYLKLCEKGRCFHTHYARYVMAKLLHKYFWSGNNNYFIAVSKFTMNELLNLGAKREKTTYIYSAPNTKIFKPPAKRAKNFNFLFVTQDLMNKAKRPELIIDSLNYIGNEVLDKISFTFTGHNKDFIREKIGKFSSKFNLPGVMTIDKLLKFYQQSYFGIHPAYTEGFPRIIFEGMSCGLPFIASNVGGMPEMVTDDCGFIFEDSKELADIITKVVLDRNIRERMSKNSREKILNEEKFVIKKYEDFFDRAGIL